MIASTAVQAGDLIALHLFLGVIIFFAVGTIGMAYVAWQDEKKRRQRQRERRMEQERAAAEFRLLVANRTAEILAQQKANEPTITVPITHCERRERRRRFLPLEDNNNNAPR